MHMKNKRMHEHGADMSEFKNVQSILYSKYVLEGSKTMCTYNSGYLVMVSVPCSMSM